jgi:outer membrane protein insertion porin family
LEEYKRQNDGTTKIPNANGDGFINVGDYIDENGNSVGSDFSRAAPDESKVDQKRFNWLEYYKIKFKADWFTKIYGKLVLRTLSEFGYLGAYKQERGIVPFERFFVGGDGLANFAQDGREIVQLRGYPNNSLSSNDGGPIYNKFSLEMRFPVTLKAAASIYILGFVEGGNAYESFTTYNPFQLKRSAGAGLRIFMPAFGLLGIDFGYGFDPLSGQTNPNGLETHFIIGQQF